MRAGEASLRSDVRASQLTGNVAQAPEGMEAALPHIDRLPPANNLRSLLDLGRTLQRLHA